MKIDIQKEEIEKKVKETFVEYNSFSLKVDEIHNEEKIINLFPTDIYDEPLTNEQADRLGFSLLTLFEFYNLKYDIKINIKYNPREEYEIFEDVNSVVEYIFNEIENSLKGVN